MENGRKIKFSVITFMVIAFLFSGAVEAKIGDNELEEISAVLKIGDDSVFSKYAQDQLKAVLNKFINKEEPETTYGILIMASFNEMEFMDAILSQRFLEKDRAYFNGVLDKRISLFSQWKKTSKNFLSVLKRGKSATPMTALALEGVDMINKTMAIFDALETLKDMRKYKGLWRYFDERMNGESHQGAWELAEAEMGFAAKSNPYSPQKLTRNTPIELEPQFLALYERWGPYATPYGISKKYKDQLAGELRNTLAVALAEESTLVKEELKPSLAQKLAAQLANIKNLLTSLLAKVNPFSAGPLVGLPQPADELADVGRPQDSAEPELTELGALYVSEPEIETVDAEEAVQAEELPVEPVSEPAEEKPADVGRPQAELPAAELPAELPTEAQEPEPDEMFDFVNQTSNPASAPTSEELTELGALYVSPQLCEKRAGDLPKQYRILINEVAWMGSQNSSNDEWIKLKNILGLPINLNGWQLQDKDKQIKIIFSEKDVIPSGGYFLLERTDDNSNPNTQADLIYSGALNNTDEALYIFDNNCQLEDEVLANPSWPAGDNSIKEPMKRFDSLYWYSGSKAPNFYGSSAPALTPAPATTPEAPSFAVLINEIAWAGTKAYSGDEWIELYNATGSSIDLTGWTLMAADGAPSITFSTSSIPAGGYFLLERTDDTTVSDILADLIYTGALGNEGEKLELRDAGNNLIDSADNSSGWAGGQASPDYISMERFNSSTWASNNLVPWEGWIGQDADTNKINGTPKTKNSVSKFSTAVTTGGFTIEKNFTLTYLGSPYLVEGSITVSAGVKLTIEPGVAIKFKHNIWGSELRVEGELEAIGGADPSQKIVFTSSSTAPAAGDWQWLYLKGAKATLENVVIEYAGQRGGNPPGSPYFTKGAVYVEKGDFTLKNSTIKNSPTLGIWLKNNTNGLVDGVEFSGIGTGGIWEKPAAIYIENATTTVQNSTFKNNHTGIIMDSFTGIAGPTVKNNLFQDNQTAVKTASLLADFSGNTGQNNNENGIVVTYFGFDDGINQMTLKPDLTYIIEGQPTVPFGKTLNIQAGATVKFKTGGRIYTEGDLKAIGLPDQKITFTALETYWDYISFSASSTNSILDNIIVSNGGFLGQRGGVSTQDGAIKINGLNMTINNSLIQNNEVGIELINAGFASQTQAVELTGNKIGIYVTGSCPDLDGITISNSQNYDIWPTACQNP